jgi:hypothetical protein
MRWCEECLRMDGHEGWCRLDPAQKRGVSRRSFLRSIGVLGTAIAVAPSLISLEPIVAVPSPAIITTSTTSLNAIWRKIQGEMIVAFETQYSEWNILLDHDKPKSLYTAHAKEITIPFDLEAA